MDTNADRVIGQELRAMREEARLTQTDVARRLGKPQSYVSKVENGERSIHLQEVFDYSQAMEIEVAGLVWRIEAQLVDFRKSKKGPLPGD